MNVIAKSAYANYSTEPNLLRKGRILKEQKMEQ